MAIYLLPPEWSDEEVADFAAKWNGQPGHSQTEFKRKPLPSPEAGIRGGPTVDHPNRRYCKDDQTCCDFCCGN